VALDPLTMYTAATIGSSLLSAASSIDGANAQAEAAKAQARAQRAQADMLIKRALINKERMRNSGVGMQKEQVAAFAASGVDLSSGSLLQVLNDTQNKIDQSVDDMMADANYEAAAIRTGAKIMDKQAGQIRQAGQIQAFGSLLSAGGNIALANR